MSEYRAAPRNSASTFEPIPVALVAATTKTVLQVATPSTTDIRVIGWGVSFDGVAGTGIPVICELIDGDAAATVTALTPDSWGNSLAPASLCVSGTTATGYNASGEGSAMTTVRELDAVHIHPQAGYGVYFPEVRIQPKVAVSRFLKIRCKAAASVNVLPWILWAEPSI